MIKTFKYIFLFALIFNSFSSFAQEVWTQKANFPGGNRHGAISFTINGKVYCGMGFNGITNFGDLWEYDPVSNSWNQKASYPEGRRFASVFVINNKGYVCGGYNGSGLLQDLIEYDPVSNSWNVKTSLPADGRYGAAGFAISNKGYVCCGNLGSASGPYTRELWEYDAQTNSWNQKADFIGNARFGLTGNHFVVDNKAYTGLGVSNGQDFTDLYCYNPATNSWTQIANYPGNGRNYMMGFSVCGFGYFGGGQANGQAKSDFWKYHPSTDTWQQLANFPGGNRWLMVASEVDHKVYTGTGDNMTSKFSDWWEYACLDVGYEEAELQTKISFFPNPVSTTFTINSDKALLSASLLLYDQVGKLVLRKDNLHGHNVFISRENLAPGLYYARLIQASEVLKTEKILVSYQ